MKTRELRKIPFCIEFFWVTKSGITVHDLISDQINTSFAFISNNVIDTSVTVLTHRSTT